METDLTPQNYCFRSIKCSATYDGSIRLLNESEEEVEEITEEIEEEDDEHQFFYTVGTGLDVTKSMQMRMRTEIL